METTQAEVEVKRRNDGNNSEGNKKESQEFSPGESLKRTMPLEAEMPVLPIPSGYQRCHFFLPNVICLSIQDRAIVISIRLRLALSLSTCFKIQHDIGAHPYSPRQKSN